MVPDGYWYSYFVDNGATDLLEVRLALSDTRPTAALMSHTVDLVTLLGTTDAFIGFHLRHRRRGRKSRHPAPLYRLR